MHEPLAHKRKALGLPFYFFCAFSAFLGRLLDWCVETRRSRELKKKGTGSQHTHMQHRHGSMQSVVFAFGSWRERRVFPPHPSVQSMDAERSMDAHIDGLISNPRSVYD
jgi:hypothetical protein